MIYGLDLHPSYQRGIPIEQLPAAGVEFIICKLSQGTDSKSYSGSVDFIRRGRASGLAAVGYHYLNDGNPSGQARTFADALHTAGVSGCLDVERGSGDINNVKTFLNECTQLGAHIALLYLPHFYWQEIGSPSLSGLPSLWSAKYPDIAQGSLAQNFGRVPSNYWNGYGNLNVEVLQFSSSVMIPKYDKAVDANAYRGTKEQFSAMLNGSTLGGFLMALSDAEQSEALGILRTLNQQIFAGDDPKHPGWSSWPGGSGERLTVVDYLRRQNVAMAQLPAQIANAVTAALNAIPAASGGIDPATMSTLVETSVGNALAKTKLTVQQP